MHGGIGGDLKMDLNEIHETYRDLPPDEAFEAFYNADVTYSQLNRVLGEDVVGSYCNWIYRNQK